MFLLLLVVWALVQPSTARAAQPLPPFPDLIIVPEGDTRVLLNAFVVDATLDEGNNAPQWRVVVRIRLHNPSRKEKDTVRLALSTNAGRLPQDLRFAVGRDERQATNFEGNTIERTLAPDERLWLTFVYTVPAGEHPWTHFYFGVNRLSKWPTTVGSVRVSVHMPRQLDREAFLLIRPDTTAYNGLLVEWQWEERVPPLPTETLLIRPSVWEDIHDLRSAAANGDEDATERLARMLTDMVTMAATPRLVVEHFYPEALAMWSTLADLRPEDPRPWREMATLYEARAQVEGVNGPYTALILAALEEAWARGDRDMVTRQHLADVIRQQVETLLAAGQYRDAMSTADRLREVLGPDAEEEALRLRYRAALAWAQARAAEGDRKGMITALNAGWGEAVSSYFLPQQPSLRYLRVEIVTQEQAREITITAALDPTAQPNPQETWDTFVRLLRASFPNDEISTTQEGSRVRARVRIPFGTADDLLKGQKRLVEVVPDMAEWALVRAALSPVRLETTRTRTLWGWRREWREEVDLSPARAALDDVIARLRVSLVTAPSPDFPQELVPLLQQQREQDLLAWQRLLDEMSAVYVLRWEAPPGPPLARRWRLAVGEHIIMQGERLSPDLTRIAILAGIALVAWTAISLGLWRWLGRG